MTNEIKGMSQEWTKIDSKWHLAQCIKMMDSEPVVLEFRKLKVSIVNIIEDSPNLID